MKACTFKGYIAKDQDGTVSLFLHDKPEKRSSEVGQGEWRNDTWDGVAIKGDFPMLSWEDEEPLCVEITLAIKGYKNQITLDL